MRNISALNYSVGAWWFQLVDQPIGGRYDGENGNNGAVDSNDNGNNFVLFSLFVNFLIFLL